MKYFHIKNMTAWDGSQIGYTLGYRRIDGRLMVTFARCGAGDRCKTRDYNKTKGRLIVDGRAAKGLVTEVAQQEGHDLFVTLRNATGAYEQKVAEKYGR